LKEKTKMENQKDGFLKPKKVFTLKLSKHELVHLRDLFSISLPVDLKTTVSQALALNQDRQMVETKLWNKIVALCQESNIPLDEESPDFVVTVTAAPPLGVFEVVSEDSQEEEEGGGGLDLDAEEDE